MIQQLYSGKKFDVVLMNPPYDKDSHGDQFYVKFINKVVNISKQLVIISPDNAFLSKSKVKNKELRENINKFKPELNISNWEGFDVFPKSNSCISVWNTEHPNDKIKVGKNLFDTQEEIILNDNEYLSKFFEKLNKFMETHDSIYDKCVANPKNNQYMDPNGRRKVQEKWDDDTTWFTVFPYCIAAFFSTFGVEQYSDKLWNGPARILVPFDNKEYAQNCYNTIHKTGGKKTDLTDFFTLISKALTKSLYIKAAEQYKYFPFLDFSKSYSNEELFKMIGMEYNAEEINKILNNNQNLR